MQCKSRRMRPRYAAGPGPAPRIAPETGRASASPVMTGLPRRSLSRAGAMANPGRLSRVAGRLVHKTRFRQPGRGVQGDSSCARTRSTPKSLIGMKLDMVIFWPSSGKAMKSGAWNARTTPSSTRLSTGCVDSRSRDNAQAPGDARMRPSVKPDSLRLCTAASPPRFSAVFAASAVSIHVFHAQVIDPKGLIRGHNFAMFSGWPGFRGVERMPHKAMHSVIHSLCG